MESAIIQVLLETKAAVTGEQSSPRRCSRCVTPREPSELPEAEEQGAGHVHTGPLSPSHRDLEATPPPSPGVQTALTRQGGRVCQGAPGAPSAAGQRWTGSCVSGGVERSPEGKLQDREGVMQTADSLQKTLMLGEIEGGRRRG